MNKQELIERLEGLKNIFGNECEYVKIDFVIELASELDEPEKAKVPQFVAEYIEWTKEEDFHLLGAMIEIRSHKNKKIDEWFEEDDNMEIFARAWLDGYEVEKEKRYSVKIRGEISENLLVYGLGINRYFFARTYDSTKRNEHTRKQLEEAEFGWVFDCEGIEIKEVE